MHDMEALQAQNSSSVRIHSRPLVCALRVTSRDSELLEKLRFELKVPEYSWGFELNLKVLNVTTN